MRKFNQHKGIAAPIIRNNIDTDSIIPSVEMKRVSKKGLSDGLFAAWRYTDRVARVPNPQFILNQEAYHGASILLSGKNFGCGSSREHAVWALDEFGEGLDRIFSDAGFEWRESGCSMCFYAGGETFGAGIAEDSIQAFSLCCFF